MLKFKTNVFSGGRILVYKTRNNANWPVLLLLLVIGGIIGSAIGQLVIKIWPSLNSWGQVYSIGLPEFTLDLQVFTFSLGFMLHVSLFTVLGFILAYLAYRKI
ncbi:MAG: DUF4321 domain-containing protein [Syntrophomonadaceae bacterium]|jgi:uncharacterized membrane protein (UPF0182 family)|nr:DUF4321 domain-containing protein [Syntrophomonadaceae bacterium]